MTEVDRYVEINLIVLSLQLVTGTPGNPKASYRRAIFRSTSNSAVIVVIKILYTLAHFQFLIHTLSTSSRHTISIA